MTLSDLQEASSSSPQQTQTLRFALCLMSIYVLILVLYGNISTRMFNFGEEQTFYIFIVQISFVCNVNNPCRCI